MEDNYYKAVINQKIKASTLSATSLSLQKSGIITWDQFCVDYITFNRNMPDFRLEDTIEWLSIEKGNILPAHVKGSTLYQLVDINNIMGHIMTKNLPSPRLERLWHYAIDHMSKILVQ